MTSVLNRGDWLKPTSIGETDEFGFNVIKDRVHVHDLHGTLLHLLGCDRSEEHTSELQSR